MMKVEVNNSFKMWLMYKPSYQNSIWVPLILINWSWNAEASRSGTSWTVSNPNKNANAAVDTTEFPSWTTNVASNIFVPESTGYTCPN